MNSNRTNEEIAQEILRRSQFITEKKLKKKYTCNDIIESLRDMNFNKIKFEGYIPSYTRTDFTDDLHDAFGFRTDYEILTIKDFKNILKLAKN